MFTSSPGRHNERAKSSRFHEQLQISALRIPLIKSLRALKENPEDCKFFNATSFHRFHVHPLKHFSPQPNDRTDSDSLDITQLLHFINQGHSLNTFNDQKDTDAGKILKEVIIVFTQSEFNISSKTETCSIHRIFSNHENFMSLPATHSSSLKFDADDEFCVKKRYNAC